MAYTRPMAMFSALLDALRGEGAHPEPAEDSAIEPDADRPRVPLREGDLPPAAEESVPQDYWAGWPYHPRPEERGRVRYRKSDWGEKRPRRVDITLTRRPIPSGKNR